VQHVASLVVKTHPWLFELSSHQKLHCDSEVFLNGLQINSMQTTILCCYMH